jgi:cyclopropane fatty-acyl-phospholipid synthase-like methyltransferase
VTTTLHPPTSEDIGHFYDQMGQFFALVWGESIHAGYWRDSHDDASFSQAQDQFTDLLIGTLQDANIQAGKQFLDVGCGTGRPAIRLAQATGCEVTGITVSQTQIGQANAAAAAEGVSDRVRFQYGNAMEMPFADNSFDAAWAFESMFHMEDRAQVLSEIRRVLRPGGVLLIADPIENTPMTEDQRIILYSAFAVSSFISKETYGDTVRQAGLELVDILDVTRNIQKTVSKTLENMPQRQAELSAIYGAAVMEMMDQSWPIVAQIYEHSIGYVVIAARKPLDA